MLINPQIEETRSGRVGKEKGDIMEFIFILCIEKYGLSFSDVSKEKEKNGLSFCKNER